MSAKEKRAPRANWESWAEENCLAVEGHSVASSEPPAPSEFVPLGTAARKVLFRLATAMDEGLDPDGSSS